MLDGLTARGREHDTAVVFFGDHGWHLGDQGEWMKTTTTRTPRGAPVDSVPWAPQSAGRVVSAPVELVDLFPTITALAGVDTSYTSHESQPLDGRDLSPLFFGGAGDDTHVARSVYPRCVANASAAWKHNDCNDTPRRRFSHAVTRRATLAALRGAGSHLRLAPKGRRPPKPYDHAGDTGTCDGAGGGASMTASGPTSPATTRRRRGALARLGAFGHRCPCRRVLLL